MALWDFLANDIEQNTKKFIDDTQGPVAQSPGSSLLGDIYSQQERTGKTAIEEAYNPVEDIPAPTGILRKLAGKAGLAGLGGMMGAAGWVKAAPSEALRTKQALSEMPNGVADFILRSPKEYRFRLGTDEQARGVFPLSKLEDVGGWSSPIPTGSESVLRDAIVKRHNRLNSPWPVQATGHESGHHIMRELNNLDGRIPGIKVSQPYFDHKLAHGYKLEHINGEVSADALAGANRMKSVGLEVTDNAAFEKWLDTNIRGKYRDREPQFFVDPQLELDPAKRVGSTKFFADWNADRLKAEKYATMNAQKQAEREAFKQHQIGGQSNKVEPGDELKDFLSQLGKPSEKVKTDLSKGGTLGEADRPWNIPTAEQAGIYDALRPGMKKYGGSYDPVQGRKNIVDLTDVDTSKMPFASSRRASPVEPGDMPSDVADYVMRKFTVLHEDTPISKEMKRKNLTNFMDWWQTASNDDRRMYSKMIEQTAEKAPPLQPKSAPRFQEMVPQGGVNKKKLQNERLRLQNIASLRKK